MKLSRLKSIKSSLFFKITIAIFSVVTILGAVNSTIIIKSTQSNLYNYEDKLSRIISQSISKTITNQILFSDSSLLQGTINSLVDGETILFAYILDSENEILVHTFTPYIPEEIEELRINRVLNKNIDMKGYGRVHIIGGEVYFGLLGNIVLGFKHPDNSLLWYKIIFGSIVTLILIVFIIITLLNRSLTAPLYSLIRGIEDRDSHGIPKKRVEIPKTYEFRELGVTINGMIDSVKESHSQLKSIFDYSLKTIIIATDKDGTITLFNKGAENILGYEASDIVGKETPLIFTNKGNNPLGIEIFTKGYKKLGYEESEWSFYTKSGSIVEINLISTPIMDSDGEPSGMILFGQDITQIIRVNHELKLHKENLEKIVEARTFELEKSILQLKETQEKLIESEKLSSLGALVAGIAHEINTPVGIGVTAASHLISINKRIYEQFKSSTLSLSDMEEFIEVSNESSKIILSNMEKASNLIKSFKEVAVDRASEEKRSFKLKEYIDEIITSIHFQIMEENYNIELNGTNTEMESYPGALSQIITNLIFNSLIHGFEEMESGTIFIETREMGDDISIIYKDNGKGINKESIKKIYDPFYTTRRGKGGSGLGLNIVYNLISSKLQGRIDCDSVEGEYTRFTIKIPRVVD